MCLFLLVSKRQLKNVFNFIFNASFLYIQLFVFYIELFIEVLHCKNLMLILFRRTLRRILLLLPKLFRKVKYALGIVKIIWLYIFIVSTNLNFWGQNRRVVVGKTPMLAWYNVIGDTRHPVFRIHQAKMFFWTPDKQN